MILLFGAAPPIMQAQEGFVDREYQIKAAYLYNFGKYVEWPPGAMAVMHNERPVFVIGIVGENPFGEALTTIAHSRKLKGRPVVIRKIRKGDDCQPCHILFFPVGQQQDLVEAVLKRAKDSPTLVVGESTGFAEKGGMINFYIDDNKVRFEINRDAANRAGLKISAKLLRLGRIVHDEQAHEE